MKEVFIDSEFITLGQFLKYIDLVQSGGHAKIFISENKILVNNEDEKRRGKKLYNNDIIRIEDIGEYKIKTK